MTVVHHPLAPAKAAAAPRLSPWLIALVAPFAGAAVGAVSRWWMRLIADEPDFSWSGTIFIVLAFTIAGAGHGLAWATRQAGARRRWTTPARVAGAVLTLPIFTGAGAMMLPTVLCGSLARGRRDWPRSVRLVLALLALPVPVMIGVGIVRSGVTPARLVGGVLLACTYVLVVWSLEAVVAPIADGWRMRRWMRIVLGVATAAGGLLVVSFVIGLATGA